MGKGECLGGKHGAGTSETGQEAAGAYRVGWFGRHANPQWWSCLWLGWGPIEKLYLHRPPTQGQETKPA